MGARSSHSPGTFSWVDLGTSDADGAKAFYGPLLGWEFDDVPVPEAPPYSLAMLYGKRVTAVYQAHQGPPNWLSYVTVEDADAAAAQAGELGATLISEPFDVMDAGRMAVIADPTGAVFAVWQPRASIGAELVNDPGALTMNQLTTTDTDAAPRFYSALFGWRFEVVSEDPQPFWSVLNGDRLNAGMMPAPDGVPAHWLVYFTVADLDASIAQIGDTGGTVTVGPVPIPAGRFAVAMDPQGAVFALFEGDVDD